MSAYYNLLDICRPKQWPTISGSEMSGNGYPVYGANGIIGKHNEFTHEKPTLMITCRGATCGNLNISEGRCYINGNAMALDELDEEKIHLPFLYCFLKKRGFEDVISGSAQPQITRQGLMNITVPKVPLEEQKRIAAILDKADSLRRKRAQAIALADDFLRATFLKMFGDPVTNPKGWDTVKLEELIASGPTNGLYKPSSDYVDSDGDLGTPILRIDGFYNGKIAKDYKFKRVLIDDQTRAKYLLQDGSIVINRVNSKEYVGKVMLVSGLREGTVFESNMMNFSVDLGRVNPRFLVDQLADEFVRRQVAVMRKDAVNQSSINQQDVKSIEIRLPKLAQQENYAEIAETIDNLEFKFNGISVDLEHFSGSLHECLLASQAR